MVIIYRISDHESFKVKPNFINNFNCLSNAYKSFSDCKWIILADRINHRTKNYIQELGLIDSLIELDFGNNSKVFLHALEIAKKFENEEIIYFLENDYLHRKNSNIIIQEGFTLQTSFVSLYDHPDKYISYPSGPNRYIKNGGEKTIVMLTNSCHWKYSNSTTLTFAAKAITIKKYFNIFKKYSKGIIPNDFKIFMSLSKKGQYLVTSIPGYSTHGEIEWITPLFNWEKVI